MSVPRLMHCVGLQVDLNWAALTHRQRKLIDSTLRPDLTVSRVSRWQRVHDDERQEHAQLVGGDVPLVSDDAQLVGDQTDDWSALSADSDAWRRGEWESQSKQQAKADRARMKRVEKRLRAARTARGDMQPPRLTLRQAGCQDASCQTEEDEYAVVEPRWMPAWAVALQKQCHYVYDMRCAKITLTQDEYAKLHLSTGEQLSVSHVTEDTNSLTRAVYFRQAQLSECNEQLQNDVHLMRDMHAVVAARTDHLRDDVQVVADRTEQLQHDMSALIAFLGVHAESQGLSTGWRGRGRPCPVCGRGAARH